MVAAAAAAANRDPTPACDPDLDDETTLPGAPAHCEEPPTPKFCVDFTQDVVNQALRASASVSRSPTSVPSRRSEALTARLVIRDSVEQTLRDYPWPFATSYMRLTVVAGSAAAPVSPDWTYAYRRPWDCVFERRLVLARGQATDPTPPPFAIGSDSGGGLIYCNVANAQLKHTGRKQCPTYEGDVLFREALICRVAAALAPPLCASRARCRRACRPTELAVEKARLILTPGKPGSVVPVVAVDTIAAHIAANVAVVNRGLVRIGARQISSFTEQAREAVAANSIFEEELRSCLRDFPWAFATAYASPLVLVAGTVTVAANDDWRVQLPPAGRLHLRAAPGDGREARVRGASADVQGRDRCDGRLLYTDQANAILEYAGARRARSRSPTRFFRDALAWRFAAISRAGARARRPADRRAARPRAGRPAR